MPEPIELRDTALAAIWRENHRHLINVGYRMLGSVSDAEDVVQEAFTRLLRSDLAQIDDVRGWLVVVVSRLCLDQLRSARVRHEAYVGPWLPEPVVGAADALAPDERVTLDDSVRMALLLVLERLTPGERVAFILHDVFQYSFDDIARIMERSSAACRQLASRARRHVQDEDVSLRGAIDPVEARRVADHFINAANTGNMDALLEVLDPEAAGWTDSGGLVPAPRERIVGRQKVVDRLLRFLSVFNVRLEAMPVNAAPGAIALQDGEIIAALTFEFSDGLIKSIHSVANPEKLGYVKAMLAGQS